MQHVTAESLRRFQEVSREALEKTRSDMEYNREGSLEEFQKTLDEKMMLGVEQAGTYLQSQLVPLLESWEAKREIEKKEWMEHIKKSSAKIQLRRYKARLENTTSGWLLASAATAGTEPRRRCSNSLRKNYGEADARYLLTSAGGHGRRVEGTPDGNLDIAQAASKLREDKED